MSKNLSSLSYRQGISKNLFERMVEAADQDGAAETTSTVCKLGEESLFGNAVTLGAVSSYDFLKAENAHKKVFVCNGSACLCARTQEKLHHDLARNFTEQEIGHICCLGRCHQGGAFQYQGQNYSGLTETQVTTLVTTGTGDAEDRYAVVSHLQPAQLTAPFPGVDAYYAPFRKLLAEGNREALAAELKEAKLRGRGGAGFPLHFKWQSCREAAGDVKYIVCNADEGDPGAYIDKYLMEQQPHSVLLGMMVAGWYAGAENGVLYIRAEYPDSVRIIVDAIAELMVVFDNCRVPAAQLLGEIGQGFAPMQLRLTIRRLQIGAWCTGMAVRALALLTEQARSRSTFGALLADRQAIQWWVADIATRIHACRLMVLDAAAKQDAGRDVRTEASMIKVFATEMASDAIDHAMQAYGAMGMTKEMPLQLLATKVRTMRIYEGPTEVHRMTIARRILDGRR